MESLRYSTAIPFLGSTAACREIVSIELDLRPLNLKKCCGTFASRHGNVASLARQCAAVPRQFLRGDLTRHFQGRTEGGEIACNTWKVGVGQIVAEGPHHVNRGGKGFIFKVIFVYLSGVVINHQIVRRTVQVLGACAVTGNAECASPRIYCLFMGLPYQAMSHVHQAEGVVLSGDNLGKG
ncbi:hypothetical protein B0H17DRAFT_1123686 [Mycena rosella]|uniref:Uncharacterized protein n=1 Tax=Mycena rosella TaxID=1033263 RepID=A0AAD7H2Q0_MYCRO|nr:hypothetical protein B0H17DRAFT_1123686 [Mycena rosella]